MCILAFRPPKLGSYSLRATASYSSVGLVAAAIFYIKTYQIDIIHDFIFKKEQPHQSNLAFSICMGILYMIFRLCSHRRLLTPGYNIFKFWNHLFSKLNYSQNEADAVTVFAKGGFYRTYSPAESLNSGCRVPKYKLPWFKLRGLAEGCRNINARV